MAERWLHRYGKWLDDRAVAAQGNIAHGAARANDQGLGVDGAGSGGLIGREMAVYITYISRERHRYAEHEGMRQITIDSQYLPLKHAKPHQQRSLKFAYFSEGSLRIR
jgi:hypothetical protein